MKRLLLAIAISTIAATANAAGIGTWRNYLAYTLGAQVLEYSPGCAFAEGDVHVLMLPGPPHECETMLRRCAEP